MLEQKLLEDLNFCPMIKYGLNGEKNPRKKNGKKPHRKICFKIHIFTENKFFKTKNRCKFCFSSYQHNRILSNSFWCRLLEEDGKYEKNEIFISGTFLPKSLSDRKFYFEIHIFHLIKTGSML